MKDHFKLETNEASLLELVRKQGALAVQATDALNADLETGGKEAAKQVRQLERTAESLRTSSFDAVRRKFPDSPLREENYRAINSIVEIVHYVSTTLREMEVLNLDPDRHLRQMGTLIRTGTLSLRPGYEMRAAGSTDVEKSVEATRRTERDTEEAYRDALADLFDAKSWIAALDSREHGSDKKFLGHYLDEQRNRHAAAAEAMAFVVDMFRRREIPGHHSSASDRLLRASDALHEIAAKTASERAPDRGGARK